MADFDAFESAAPLEEDPAAEFLAREQDQLAGLEDDGFMPTQGSADFAMTDDPYADPSAHDYQYAAQPTTVEDSGFAAISQADKQRAEPEKIRLWREEQKARLEEKDIESEKRKAEWREAAKKELEEWYRHRAEQLEKTKVNNREHEAAVIQERDDSIPGHEWERICRLCEFNPKQSGNKKDVSRQRSILLQLKQTPLVH